MKPDTIPAYHKAQTADDRRICDALQKEINQHLSDAESKIWHGHPVWFLDDNPIVGYSKLKNAVCLLFWSGQSFETPGLAPMGRFKSAKVNYTAVLQIDKDAIERWMAESRKIQWDYKNVVKRKGKLERLG